MSARINPVSLKLTELRKTLKWYILAPRKKEQLRPIRNHVMAKTIPVTFQNGARGHY